jgi:hypothetical protein
MSGFRLQRAYRQAEFSVMQTCAAGQGGSPGSLEWAPTEADGELDRGESIQIRATVQVLKALRVRRAASTLIVEFGPTSGLRRQRRVVRSFQEMGALRNRRYDAGQTIEMVFEHRLFPDLPPSSAGCSWRVEVEARARGAPDYLQQKRIRVR